MLTVSYHTLAAEAKFARWVDAASILVDVQSTTVMLPMLEQLLAPMPGIEVKAVAKTIIIRQGSETLVTVGEV